MTGTLRIVHGPTTSGKTTHARWWAGRDPEKRRVAGTFEQAIHFLQEGYDVILDDERLGALVTKIESQAMTPWPPRIERPKFECGHDNYGTEEEPATVDNECSKCGHLYCHDCNYCQHICGGCGEEYNHGRYKESHPEPCV